MVKNTKHSTEKKLERSDMTRNKSRHKLKVQTEQSNSAKDSLKCFKTVTVSCHKKRIQRLHHKVDSQKKQLAVQRTQGMENENQV